MMRAIVVVDDEPEILGLICDLLRDEGYTVLSLGRATLLSALSAEVQPVLFLLDLMMPMIGGIEAARRLRGSGHQATPMVAMSASDRLLTDARGSGLFDSTLRKPFELLDLLETVESYAA